MAARTSALLRPTQLPSLRASCCCWTSGTVSATTARTCWPIAPNMYASDLHRILDHGGDWRRAFKEQSASLEWSANLKRKRRRREGFREEKVKDNGKDETARLPYIRVVNGSLPAMVKARSSPLCSPPGRNLSTRGCAGPSRHPRRSCYQARDKHTQRHADIAP